MSLTLENYGTEYYYDDLAYHNYDMYDFLTESHPRRGDIQVELTSPHGTKSVLLPYRKFDFVNYVGYSNWPFMSVHHWGESPLGTWKLKVSFKSSSGSVTVHVNGLELYGVSTTPVSVLNIPKNCDSKCADRCSAEHCDSCANVRNVTTLECMDKCDDTLQICTMVIVYSHFLNHHHLASLPLFPVGLHQRLLPIDHHHQVSLPLLPVGLHQRLLPIDHHHQVSLPLLPVGLHQRLLPIDHHHQVSLPLLPVGLHQCLLLINHHHL